MPATASRLIGISEVGHVTDAPADVPWGNTQQEGVTLQMTADTVELMSAQAKMREDVSLVSANIQLVIALIVAELTALQRLWGLPDDALEGDLTGGVPEDEVLTIEEGNLGTQERALYVLGPGPVSTRRIEVARARIADIGNIQMGSTAYTLPQATWSVLNPAPAEPAVHPLVITDAV